MTAKLGWAHYVLLVAGLVIILGPALATALGVLHLGKAVSVVTAVVGFAVQVTSLVKQWEPDANADVPAKTAPAITTRP